MSYADQVSEMFPDEEIYQLDGFDDCIIGYTDRPAPALVYSCVKILKQLEEHDGMTAEGAAEYFDFNILRAIDYASLGCVMVWDR